MVKEPTDQSVRLEALSPGQSFHVESPAGAGKTSLLTARFIHLLALVDHPKEILALTFTNKAANEMQARIRFLLQQADAGLPLSSDWAKALQPQVEAALKKHRRHNHLFQSPDGLQVMTFHSFCYQLIKQAPIDARVPLESAILDEADQQELIREAVKETQNQLMARPSSDPGRQALEHCLLYMNNNWSALADDLARLIAQRDLLLDLIREIQSNPGLAHLDQVLRDRLGTLVGFTLQDLGRQFGSSELGSNWRSLYDDLANRKAGFSKNLSSRLPDIGWEDLTTWQAIASLCITREGRARRRFGPAGGFYSGFGKTAFAGHIENLPEGVLRLLQKTRRFPAPGTGPPDLSLLFDMILLVGQALEQFDLFCRRQGGLDFVELELAALRALQGNDGPADLQLVLDQRLNHILVDEFQDTSHNQWQLIQSLCAGWSPGDGRTLFIVGDPKQSIYGFRKAEVSLFLKAREGLPLPGTGLLPLKSLYIGTNFRSRRGLVQFVNDLFSRTIMADPNREADEVDFQGSLAAPEMTNLDPGEIRLALFPKGQEEKHQASRHREAAWLAQGVKKIREAFPGDSLGILLFARTNLPFYLESLYEHGLQVQVQEGLLLQERPEIMDLLSLTRALVRPQDDISWLSLIRSAWCWVNLDQLYQAARFPAPSFCEKILGWAETGGTPEPVRLLGLVLRRSLEGVGRLPLHWVVEKAWEKLSGPRFVGERYGATGVSNSRTFLQLLLEAEKAVPEETLKRLEFLLSEAYAPPDPMASRTAVQIMTVHRAKGLEFDRVFIPHLDWSPASGGRWESPLYLLERLPGGSEGHLIGLRPDRRTKEDEGIYGLLKRMKKERKLGESKRLFYVALTRAKKALHLSGLAKMVEEEYKPPTSSLLSYILDHPGKEEFLEILENPPLADTPPGKTRPDYPEDLPSLPFFPEPIPYRIQLPSQMSKQTFIPEILDRLEEVSLEEITDPLARARGIIIHRIFQDLSLGKEPPTPAAVAQALMAEGLDWETASMTSADLLEEVAACRNESFCLSILGSDFPFAASEWGLEDRLDKGTIRSGVIDRIVFDGKEWLLVDYKTGRLPDEMAVKDFLEQQAALYRDQLLAYKEMLAKAKSVEPDRIRLFLYFTALQKAKEVT